MPIFSQEITIRATAYIRAETEAEAYRLALQHFGDAGGELPIGTGIDVVVSGLPFDDPRLADVSISPAVTFERLNGRPRDAEG